MRLKCSRPFDQPLTWWFLRFEETRSRRPGGAKTLAHEKDARTHFGLSRGPEQKTNKSLFVLLLCFRNPFKHSKSASCLSPTASVVMTVAACHQMCPDRWRHPLLQGHTLSLIPWYFMETHFRFIFGISLTSITPQMILSEDFLHIRILRVFYTIVLVLSPLGKCLCYRWRKRLAYHIYLQKSETQWNCWLSCRLWLAWEPRPLLHHRLPKNRQTSIMQMEPRSCAYFEHNQSENP